MKSSKEDVKRWFFDGRAEKAKFMVVCIDTFAYEEYPKYAKTDWEVNEVVIEREHGLDAVQSVFDLSLNFETQYASGRVWHLPELSEKDRAVLRARVILQTAITELSARLPTGVTLKQVKYVAREGKSTTECLSVEVVDATADTERLAQAIQAPGVDSLELKGTVLQLSSLYSAENENPGLAVWNSELSKRLRKVVNLAAQAGIRAEGS